MSTLTTRGQSHQLLEPVANHNSYKQSVTNHETVSGTLTADVFIQNYKPSVTNHETVSGILTADVFIKS